MKEQTLITVLPTQNQQNDIKLLNVFRLQHGILYLRWPVLSALCEILLIYLCFLIWSLLPISSGVFSFLNTNFDLYNLFFWLPCACIWLLFSLGWLLSFLFGYQFIEVPQQDQEPKVARVTNFIRSISDFERIRWFLCIFVVPSFLSGMAIGFFNRLQIIPFSFSIILLFIFIWAVCNHALYGWLNKRIKVEPLEKNIMALLSPKYLFCCVINNKSLLRKKLISTTIAGMQKPSSQV